MNYNDAIVHRRGRGRLQKKDQLFRANSMRENSIKRLLQLCTWESTPQLIVLLMIDNAIRISPHVYSIYLSIHVICFEMREKWVCKSLAIYSSVSPINRH